MNLSLSTMAWFVPSLLLIEGFFSGSEIALLSADKLNLRTGTLSYRRKLTLELATHPERVLSTTLMMTSICMIGISSLIAIYVLSLGLARSELVSIAVTSPIIVIFGELLPKTIFQRYADRIAPWVAPIVNAVYWLGYPVTRTLSTYTAQLSRLIGPIEELLSGRRHTTRDDLETMLSFSRRETEIKASEKRMIRRILDFKDTEAKHTLIPLVRIEGIELKSTVQQTLERFETHRHSRMPVYEDRIDNIVGVVELKRLAQVSEPTQSLKPYITRAQYVAETQSLRDLVLEMSQTRQELVVVVDEYGGAIGILTFEDIVEEIVGEIPGEDESGSQPYRQTSDDSWLIQARMEITSINESLNLELPEGDYETLGGFLLQQFGRIPETGDELYFDTSRGNLKLTIKRANERAIEAVLVDILNSDQNSQSE